MKFKDFLFRLKIAYKSWMTSRWFNPILGTNDRLIAYRYQNIVFLTQLDNNLCRIYIDSLPNEGDKEWYKEYTEYNQNLFKDFNNSLVIDIEDIVKYVTM